MKILNIILNWIFSWIICGPDSTLEWIIKMYRIPEGSRQKTSFIWSARTLPSPIGQWFIICHFHKPIWLAPLHSGTISSSLETKKWSWFAVYSMKLWHLISDPSKSGSDSYHWKASSATFITLKKIIIFITMMKLAGHRQCGPESLLVIREPLGPHHQPKFNLSQRQINVSIRKGQVWCQN